jgi:hypothetical protein
MLMILVYLSYMRSYHYFPENENYDEYQTCPFEFVQDDFEGPILFKNTAWGVNIGLSLTFHRYSIDIRYTNVLESVGQIGQFLLIERKPEALNFMVGYNF